MKIARLSRPHIIFIVAAVLAAAAAAAQVLPPNVLRAQQELLLEAQQITFIIAFLAGVLSFVSPCTWPALAPFFAFGFKEKRRITRMTAVFFAGYAAVFILLGLLASTLGGIFERFKMQLALAAGVLLVILGIYTFFGRGFALARINHKFRNDDPGVFLMGTAFAVGFTPCVGPILAGVLIIAATLAKFQAVLLMLAYALGVFAPLFVLAVAWDKMGWFRGIVSKEVVFFGKPRSLAHIIAGGLLTATGLVFIFLRDTSFANTWDPFGVKTWWFVVQETLASSPLATAAGVAVLAAVVLLVLATLRAQLRKPKVE